MSDFYIIIATLVIACITSIIISLGNIKNVIRESFPVIIARIVFLIYSGVCAYSFIKFLEIYFDKNQ